MANQANLNHGNSRGGHFSPTGPLTTILFTQRNDFVLVDRSLGERNVSRSETTTLA